MKPRSRSEELRTRARRYIHEAAPRDAAFHLLPGASQSHLFLVDGSALFDLDPAAGEQLAAAAGGPAAAGLLAAWQLAGSPRIDDTPLPPPRTHALSLAVAQSCNLGCSYCYAEQGSFGTRATRMPLETALSAVDLLIDDCPKAGKVNLAFLGGEPLANRAVLRETTRYAAARAEKRGVSVGFAITTNGTLLTEEDADFFEQHAFAVTVSLDGPRAVHDALRPDRRGRGSFDRIMRNIRPLLERQRRMQVSARVTVTPRNLKLRATLEAFVAEGFHTVGFAPMLSSPTGSGEMSPDDLVTMLGEMIDCGHEFERRTLAQQAFPFANMLNALREIERGTHRPYPCGAAAGYLGVGADGKLAACHRFVEDPAGAMGTLAEGIDGERQTSWLAQRHVHRQQPCRTCWARYLCGGGCHHEVLRRGRPACDYVRGWLHYCLEAYLRLSSSQSVQSAAAQSVAN